MTQMNPLKDQMNHLKEKYKKKEDKDPQKKFFEFNPYLKVSIERRIIVEAENYDEAVKQLKESWDDIIYVMGGTLSQYAQNDEQCTDFQRRFKDEDHESEYSKSTSNLDLLEPKEWKPWSDTEPLYDADYVVFDNNETRIHGRQIKVLYVNNQTRKRFHSGGKDMEAVLYGEFNEKGKKQHKLMSKKEDV